MFRRQVTIGQNASVVAAIRGAKKKKGGAIEAPTSKDLVNIFKDREDPLIYPSEAYPPYVMNLIGEKFQADDVMI